MSFPVDVDFDALLEKDSHVAGWIFCEDTPLNYPVMQWSDNIHYLTFGMNGDNTTYGAVFMDAANAPDGTDINTILYGHHMNNGSMFACVAAYKQQEYLDAHPVMWFATPNASYRADIYSCYVTVPDSESYDILFAGEAEYAAWIEKTLEKSLVKAEVSPNVSSKILTLSTCSYEFEGARCVLHAVLTLIE